MPDGADETLRCGSSISPTTKTSRAGPCLSYHAAFMRLLDPPPQNLTVDTAHITKCHSADCGWIPRQTRILDLSGQRGLLGELLKHWSHGRLFSPRIVLRVDAFKVKWRNSRYLRDVFTRFRREVLPSKTITTPGGYVYNSDASN